LRIPLIVRTEKGEEDTHIPRPLLVAIGKIRRKLFRAEFLVDTGGPYTLLGYSDFQRLRLPLKGRMRSMMIAGFKLRAYSQGEVELNVGTEDREITSIVVRNLYACERAERHIPSILGVDTLRDNNLVLVFDAANGMGYLEKS